jgi:hypothetical protein
MSRNHCPKSSRAIVHLTFRLTVKQPKARLHATAFEGEAVKLT